MNEEEKKLLKIYKAQVEKEENEYFSVNAYTQLLYDSHKTVLNLITKLQKENEDIKSRKEHQKIRFKRYKENIDKQHEEIYENLVFENEKYKYLYQKALDNTVKADKENMQLKKQIDLMINFMYEIWCKYPGSISHELRLNGFNDDECGTCENTDRNCVKCLKQYFEKKAEAEGE